MAICVQGLIGGPGEKPVTEFSGFGFNSMAAINGLPIGANSDGLFLLNSGDDDDGVSFERSFTMATTDFGDRHPKTLRFIYVGFLAGDQITFEVTVDGKVTASVTAKPKTTGLQRIRVPFPRKKPGTNTPMQGRYWTFTVKSTKPFTIDSIEIMPIIRSSGVGGY